MATVKKKRQLSEQELYDIVIVLVEYNKVNPRKRWSELAEKIMTLLEMNLVYEDGNEVLSFDDEDKEFK